MIVFKKNRGLIKFLAILNLLFLFFGMMLLPGLFLSVRDAAAVEAEDNPQLWAKLWGTTDMEYPSGIATDDSGNTYLTVRSSSGGSSECILVKFNSNGAELWRKSLLKYVDGSYKVSVANDGSIYVCGGTHKNSELLKFDAEGSNQWTRSLDLHLGAWPSVSADPAGNIYVAGYSDINPIGETNYDTFLAKFNGKGEQQWLKQLGTDKYDRVAGVSAQVPGTVAILGETKGAFDGCANSGGWSDSFVAQFTSDGNFNWVKQTGPVTRAGISSASMMMSMPYSIAADSKGNIYTSVGLAPWSNASTFGDNWQITKYSPSGGVSWSVPLPAASTTEVGLAVDTLGTVYAYGMSLEWANGQTVYNLYLAKYGADGRQVLTKSLDTSGSTTASGIAIGKYGDIFVTGDTYLGFSGNKNAGGADTFLVRYQGDDYDTDEDGLPDRWETRGVTIKDTFIDLPAMGADPEKKDIFVEVDWMPGKKPKNVAIAKVVEAFAKAPVDNPDKSRGINLHVDLGSGSVMDPNTGKAWGNRSKANEVPYEEFIGSVPFLADDYDWDEFDEIKEANFDQSRSPIFHYAIFANKLGDLKGSGLSRGFGASDFIVSLGGWSNGHGSELEQAGTFMHELGHNLGLHHGGVDVLGTPDEVMYKPNYLSVMNYSFQTVGLITYDPATGVSKNGTLDYSRFDDIEPLDESSLDEIKGLTSFSRNKLLDGYSTIYFQDGVGRLNPTNGPRPIDWDNDGTITASGSVSVNINWGPTGKGGTDWTVLRSYEDWNHLIYKGGSIGQTGASMEDLPSETPVIGEITVEEDALLPHPYKVIVNAPENITKNPGGSTSFIFTVANKGDESDIYTLQANSGAGWADLSQVPASVTLAPEESINIPVNISIPAAAVLGQEDLITLTATSQANNLISDSQEVSVIARWQSIQSIPVTNVSQADPDLTNSDPVDIYGDKIVWAAENRQVFLHDLGTGQTRQLTSAGLNKEPRIHGDRVVYRNMSGNDNSICVFDLATDTESKIITMPASNPQSHPDIYQNKIVWASERIDGNSYNTDIYMYDLTTGTEQRITTDNAVQNRPRIYGSTIVWEDSRRWEDSPFSGTQICTYDLNTGTERRLFPSNSSQSMPDIYENLIVFVDNMDTSSIYLYDLSTGSERLICSEMNSNRKKPAVYGSTIVWEDWRQGNYSGYVNESGSEYSAVNSDIYMYDLNTNTEQQVDSSLFAQAAPGIWGDKIVFKDTRDSRSMKYTRIYAATLGNAPSTSLKTNPAVPDLTGVYGTLPMITLTSDSPDSLTYYQWDKTGPLGWSGYTGEFGAPEGEHVLYYYSVDKSGNTEDVKSRTVKVDTTPPLTTMSCTPSFEELAIGVFRTVPEIALAADEPGTTYYQWDSTSGEHWTTYSAPIQGLVGDHILYYYSTDAHGNAGQVQSQWFKVDTNVDETAPITTLISAPTYPDEGTFAVSPVVYLTADESSVTYYQWDTPVNADSDDIAAPIEWIGGTDPVYAPFTSGSTLYRGGFLAPKGTHTLYYCSVDAAGNGEQVKSKTFSVSFAAEAVDVVITTPSSMQNVEDAVYAEGNVIGAANEVIMTVDGQSPVRVGISAEKTFSGKLDTSRLAAGTHTLRISASNNLGNTGEDSVMFNVLPDLVPPETELLTVPPPVTSAANVSFTYKGTDNRTHPQDIKYLYKLEGVDEDYRSGAAAAADFRGLAEGSYTFRVKAVDMAGNIDPTEAAYSFTVEKTPATDGSPDSSSDSTDNDDKRRTPQPQVPVAPLFVDMKNHWAEETVYELVYKGAITGYQDNTFRPDNNLTRAEAAVILARVLGLSPGKETDLVFKDKEKIPHWARGLVAAAFKADLLKGYQLSDGSVVYNPAQNITRAELVCLIERALEGNPGNVDTPVLKFLDAKDIPGWSVKYIGIALTQGIVQGYPDNTFRAQDSVTRAEAVSMVVKMLKVQAAN